MRGLIVIKKRCTHYSDSFFMTETIYRAYIRIFEVGCSPDITCIILHVYSA